MVLVVGKSFLILCIIYDMWDDLVLSLAYLLAHF